jgi:hypothetical protein
MYLLAIIDYNINIKILQVLFNIIIVYLPI